MKKNYRYNIVLDYSRRLLPRAKYFFFFFQLVFIFFSSAQDTIGLHEVTISPRYGAVISKHNWRKPDSLFLELFRSSAVSDLLMNENIFFIKSYGPGGIATSAARGGSSAQTAVLWNGFNIKNPMLGETDLSLLSVFLMDEVSLQPGGATSLWGNASVAGTLHLQNRSLFNSGNQISFFSSYGSFDNRTAGIKFSFSDKKRFSTTRIFHKSALNNFSFVHPENGSETIQRNNALIQTGVLQELGLRIKENQFLVFRIWALQSDRDIPPANFQQPIGANQKDVVIRSALEWSKQKGKLKTLVRQAAFHDHTQFSNPFISLQTNSTAFSFISEAEWNWQSAKAFQVQWGINNTHYTAVSDAYLHNATQNSAALFGGINYKSRNERRFFNAHARLEHTRQRLQPITFSVECLQKIYSFAQLRASINKLYRLPTLNDLYWNPGGNPSLLPEEGFSEDLSVLFQADKNTSKHRIKAELSLGAFSRQMNNWIIWLPGSDAVWTPQNLLRVWSRGTETHLYFLISGKQSRLRLHLNTQYILSTQQQARSVNDQSLGKQLIYTPLYSGSGGVQWYFRSVYLSIVQTYTGYRYISSDNFQYLKPYTLANFAAGYRMKLKNATADINFILNNLLDTRYQIVANRPMPGRNYLLNFTFQLHHKKQKS